MLYSCSVHASFYSTKLYFRCTFSEFELSELEEPVAKQRKPEYRCERENCGKSFHDRDSVRDHIRQHYGLDPLGDCTSNKIPLQHSISVLSSTCNIQHSSSPRKTKLLNSQLLHVGDTAQKEDAEVFDELESSFSSEKPSKRLRRYVCKYRGELCI